MTTAEAVSKVKQALREVVESRGSKSATLDDVTRKALVAFGLMTDCESVLAGESPACACGILRGSHANRGHKFTARKPLAIGEADRPAGGEAMRAPFPWFGGKSRAAHLVWGAFGDVPNYVEPFAGSLAVLLGRPFEPRIEAVNDLDCFLSNFWRAVRAAPDQVASYADWPVNEADLHARPRWLVGQAEFREKMKHDPDYYDARVAGWWVWGICQWIGGGWCSAPEGEGEGEGRTNASRAPPTGQVDGSEPPHLYRPRHVHTAEHAQRPNLYSSNGVHNRGVAFGPILKWMTDLQHRLRRVRVCCGDWKRVLGRSSTELIGITGVFLDPPYGTAAGRDPGLYAQESLDVAAEVRAWALEHGDNKRLRIALCGYEGEHEMPSSWQCVAWKANGGYASSAGNHDNAKRERIWFSPHCARAKDQAELFSVSP